jgi:hypothetical protein
MWSVKIYLIKSFGAKELLHIFWIFAFRYLRWGSVYGLFSMFSFTFLIKSYKNIFIMLKSFFKFYIILLLNGDSKNDLNYSSVKMLQSNSFPSFSRMNDRKIIAHWYLDKTNRIRSAVSRVAFNDPSSKHSYSFIDMWLIKTALFLLNKK